MNQSSENLEMDNKELKIDKEDKTDTDQSKNKPALPLK